MYRTMRDSPARTALRRTALKLDTARPSAGEVFRARREAEAQESLNLLANPQAPGAEETPGKRKKLQSGEEPVG